MEAAPIVKPTVTKQQITEALLALGLTDGDNLLVHSALGKVGKIEGSAQTVIDAIEGIIGKEGTLIMPTFSQVDFENSYKTWYMDKPSDVGYLTEYFRKLPFVYRSNQETHSVAARGKLAYELTYQHKWFGPHICPYGEYAFADSSPWQKMYNLNVKTLGFGVTMASFTFKHLVEIRVMEHFLGMLKTEEDYKEMTKDVMTYETHPKGFWTFYVSRDEMQAELTARGLVKEYPLGNATLWMVNGKEASDVTYEILMAEPERWFDSKKIEWMNKCIELANK